MSIASVMHWGLTKGFTAQFASVVLSLLQHTKAFRWSFILIAGFGMLIVMLDIFSAVSLSLVLVSLGLGKSLSLPVLGEVGNPLSALSRGQAVAAGLGIFILLQVLRELSSLINELLSNNLGLRVGWLFRQKMSERLLLTEPHHLSSENKNNLILYNVSFAPAAGFFTVELAKLFGVVILVAFYAASACVADWRIFLVISVTMLLLTYVTNKLLLQLQAMSEVTRALDLKYHEQAQDMVGGQKELIIGGMQGAYLASAKALAQRIFKKHWTVALIRSCIPPFQRAGALVIIGGLTIMLLLSGFDLFEEPERILLVLFLIVRMQAPVTQLNSVRASLLSRVAPIETILTFLKETPSQPVKDAQAQDQTQVEIPVQSQTANLLRPSVTLSQIGFSHQTDKAKETTQILSGVSLSIPAGKTTAIVGPTGSGKSTVIDLLCGFWLPQAGDIEINGASLHTEIDLLDWRAQVAVIRQNGHIFSTSIRNNITLFRQDYSEADLAGAIRQADLDDVIASKPDGLEANLGGQQSPLSGGQQQRVQIARAILQKPQLLVLDEATSAQDAVAEQNLYKTIEQQFPHITKIIVAHRFSGIKSADHIIVMDKGRVVGQGTQEELLASNALFQSLFQAQELR